MKYFSKIATKLDNFINFLMNSHKKNNQEQINQTIKTNYFKQTIFCKNKTIKTINSHEF